MSIFLDLGVVIVVLLTVLWCYKRGFFRTLFGLLGTVVSIILAASLGSFLSDKIYDSFIKDKILTKKYCRNY